MKPYYDDGQIQIWHGDCRDVLPTLEVGSVSLLLTDPPYGDDHDTDYERFSGGKTRENGESHPRYQYPAVANDSNPFDPSPLLRFRQVIIFGANRFSDLLPTGTWIIWDKRTPTGSKGVMSDAEVAWFSRGRGVYIYTHTWDGFNRASEARTHHHPTQKPVALMVWLVERYTKPGDLVLDPYMGSGPIAQACHMTGRRYIGIELEEIYCERAVKRLQQGVLAGLEVTA